jgi:hypothetical protein
VPHQFVRLAPLLCEHAGQLLGEVSLDVVRLPFAGFPFKHNPTPL